GGVPVAPARGADAGPRRSKLDTRLLLDRKRVQVRPQGKGLARPLAPEVGDDARLGRTLDFKPAERGERLVDELRRLDLLVGELGMRVQVAPPGDRLRPELRGDEAAHPGI